MDEVNKLKKENKKYKKKIKELEEQLESKGAKSLGISFK